MTLPPVSAPPARVSAPLSPLERLEALCDPGSLEQLGPAADGVGVLAARGRVGGRPIACYAQDARVAGGSVGVDEARVIVGALRHSGAEGIPLIAFIKSAGARLQEGTSALGAFGRIFFSNVALSGHVPQISVITGTSAGGGCYSPALTDFVVMTGQASMFLTGPKIVRQALGEEVGTKQLGGPDVHQRNGVCQLVAADPLEAVALSRELLGFLPQHAGDRLPRRDPEPPRGDPGAAVPDDPRQVYDVREVIRAVADGGRFLEIAPRWARNIVVGFARLEGHPVGVVANQTRHLGGIIDVEASQKGARFIRTCDAFGVPLVALVDTPGFMPGTRQERAGIIRHGADLLRAFAAATVPRATVIVRKAFGGAFITMNSKDLGAHAVFAWRGADVGIMGAHAAVAIMHRRELAAAARVEEEVERLATRYAARELSAGAALRRGVIDEVIDPAETRGRLARTLLPDQRPVGLVRRRQDVPRSEGCTVWFTGLAGAGKSTIASRLARELRERGEKVEVLDGDLVRRSLSRDLGFSREEWEAHTRRVAFVADLLSRNGVRALVAGVSPYRDAREEARGLIGGRFVEVHVTASLEECMRRDTTGSYDRALRGEIEHVTGISAPYEEPLAPEIVLDTEHETPEESVAKVLAAIAGDAAGEAAA